MKQETIDHLVVISHRYNLDKLIETILSWDPVDIRKWLIKLYIFSANAALHTDYLREEDIQAIEVLQQIIESMENIEYPQDSLLTIKAK